jgi:hypothetical protein
MDRPTRKQFGEFLDRSRRMTHRKDRQFVGHAPMNALTKVRLNYGGEVGLDQAD